MGIKNLQADLAARRLMTARTSRTSPSDGPRRPSPSAMKRPAAATSTATSPAVTRVVATSAATASSTSSARQGRRARPRSRRRVRPEPHRATSRCSTTRTARSATSSRPVGLTVGDTLFAGATAPTSARATRCRCRTSRSAPMIHNVELKPGRGAQMIRSAGTWGQLMAKEGDYAQVRLPSGAVRKVLHRVPRHHRPARQHRARDHPHRQGRQEPLAGHPPHRPRSGHEPGRPPARRWRRQVRPGQPAPGLAVGQEDQGSHHPQEQADRQVHRQRAPQGVRSQ